MNRKLAQFFNLEISNYKNAVKAKNLSDAWIFLERAHILGQFHWKEHLLIHFKMLNLALKTFNWREIIGQLPRLLLAAPGSLFRSAPRGNVGTSRVGIFVPMPIPEDLIQILNSCEIND